MDDCQPELGRILKELRAEKRIGSQDDMASKAGIDQRTVSSVENGGKVLDSKIVAICEVLGITIGQLRILSLERKRDSPSENTKKQKIAERSADSPFLSAMEKLQEIDVEVKRRFGSLENPTRSDGKSEFSSGRLISSLSTLGIPLEISFNILGKLPNELEKQISNSPKLSTGHIRSAVAQLISELRPVDIRSTEIYQIRAELSKQSDGEVDTADPPSIDEIKFDWASRYARRYGNPNQIMQILELDGKSHRLDYNFLKNELLPHVLRRILGEGFSIAPSEIVNPSVVSEMARSTLEEFRRLGLYTIRYRTALWLAEDIAIHPPHPWVVSQETRSSTIRYDFDRANANLGGLKDAANSNVFEIRHRFSEVIHHLCSAILATYNGFLGQKYTSSLYILRNWLSLEHENFTLWRTCELRFIESDLLAVGISLQDFSSLLKRVDVSMKSHTDEARDDLVLKCEKLTIVAEKLASFRNHMKRLEEAISNSSRPHGPDLQEITRETLISCFGCKKVRPVTDRVQESVIGFASTPAFERTVLSGRPPLCVFIFCNDDRVESDVTALISRSIDQINAHKLAETCLILCHDEPSDLLKEKVRIAEKALPSSQIIRTASLMRVRSMRRDNTPIDQIIDDVFSD